MGPGAGRCVEGSGVPSSPARGRLVRPGQVQARCPLGPGSPRVIAAGHAGPGPQRWSETRLRTASGSGRSRRLEDRAPGRADAGGPCAPPAARLRPTREDARGGLSFLRPRHTERKTGYTFFFFLLICSSAFQPKTHNKRVAVALSSPQPDFFFFFLSQGIVNNKMRIPVVQAGGLGPRAFRSPQEAPPPSQPLTQRPHLLTQRSVNLDEVHHNQVINVCVVLHLMDAR